MDRGSDCEVRCLDGPAKLDIEIKSDWLVVCFTFVTKSPGIAIECVVSAQVLLEKVSLVELYVLWLHCLLRLQTCSCHDNSAIQHNKP